MSCGDPGGDRWIEFLLRVEGVRRSGASDRSRREAVDRVSSQIRSLGELSLGPDGIPAAFWLLDQQGRLFGVPYADLLPAVADAGGVGVRFRGETPFTALVKDGRMEALVSPAENVVEKLALAGFDPFEANSEGETALSLSRHAGSERWGFFAEWLAKVEAGKVWSASAEASASPKAPGL